MINLMKTSLVDTVLNQIIKDIQSGDLTAVEELLNFVPMENLCGYLPEGTFSKDEKKKKYSHAFMIAFTVETEHSDLDGDEVTEEELLDGLDKRYCDLKRSGEIIEAVGKPYDTYEIEG